MQRVSGNCWLFVGVLLGVLVIDLVVLNYSQQCSLYVQLDEAAAGGGGGRQAQIRTGLKAVDSRQSGQDETEQMSLFPDIKLRGKWQQKQVDKFCQKYGEDKLLYILPNNSSSEKQIRYKLLRHLLYDDERKAVLCFIPKVGCTNLKRFFFLNQGLIPEDALDYNMSDSWEHARLEGRFLQPGVVKKSFLNEELSDEQRLLKIKTYFKFTFVRHPLERLLSAYLDKISPPLQREGVGSADAYQRYILMKTRKEDYDRWNAMNGSYNLLISFSEFIQWWVGSDSKYVDEHYASLVVNSQPCRVRYDFYGVFRQYSEDMAMVIQRLNASGKHFSKEGAHPPGKETGNKMADYYSQLSLELKTALYEHIYKDLEFYYHLLPEERDSHKAILGFS